MKQRRLVLTSEELIVVLGRAGGRAENAEVSGVTQPVWIHVSLVVAVHTRRAEIAVCHFLSTSDVAVGAGRTGVLSGVLCAIWTVVSLK